MSAYWLRVVAALEISGGVSGLLSLAAEAMKSALWVGVVLGQLVPASFFLLSLVAGLQLWRDTRTGYWASIAVQVAQLPKLVTASFVFMMSFGFDVMAIRVPGPTGYGLAFRAAVPEYHLWLPDGLGVDAGVGFSILSCVNLYFLGKRLKRPGKDDERVAETPRPRSDQSDWVMPFWMRLGGIVLLLLFALCAGRRVAFLSSPH